MSPLAPVLAAMLAQQPAAAPPVQRPTPVRAAQPTTVSPTAPAPATTSPATTPAPGTTPTTAAAPPPATPAVTPAPMPGTTPAPSAAPAPPPATLPAGIGPAIDATPPVPQDTSAAPVTTVIPPEPGPPFYKEADMQALRQRYGLEVAPPVQERKPVFRCWVADPTCGFVVEVNATSAYAYRLRQGSINMANDINRWSSARVQYDVWFSIPTMVETRGKLRYTRLSLGPKGGVIASDSKDIWGNVGLAGRYWFGRGRFAPNLEFTSSLVFKVAGINRDGKFDNVRGPLGFSADIGFGLGGFGSIVVGGQFDSPLAGEQVSDVERVSAAGMFYIGFRGNIVWGAPAAIAVGTHAITNRRVTAP